LWKGLTKGLPFEEWSRTKSVQGQGKKCPGKKGIGTEKKNITGQHVEKRTLSKEPSNFCRRPASRTSATDVIGDGKKTAEEGRTGRIQKRGGKGPVSVESLYPVGRGRQRNTQEKKSSEREVTSLSKKKERQVDGSAHSDPNPRWVERERRGGLEKSLEEGGDTARRGA